MSESLFDVLVQSAKCEAKGVLSFELCRPDGSDLPAFTAGSNIDFHLPNGIVRNYSLVNSQDERHRYVIAVALDANSRGGSRYIFEYQLVGQMLQISAPRNNFKLAEDAPRTVLIGGGIGITPLHSMVLRLQSLNKDWTLYYGARERACAAFREEFEALAATHPGRVHLNFDLEQGQMLDIARIVSETPRDAHLYCCGPLPMLEAFKTATFSRPSDMVHLEYFAAPPTPPASILPPGLQPFTVVLAKSGKEFEIQPGQSILDVLLDNGVHAASSCRSGECGSCVVDVLEGEPRHRDYVLSENEKASNKVMTICVSGSRSKRLVIDL